MESDAANATRTRARTGTYEAWYLTVSDPDKRQGYWIRYTSFNPGRREAHDEAHCALWAFRFDHEDLRWDSRERPFPFIRPPWDVVSSFANVGSQPAIKVFGTIDVNGKRVHLEHLPGGQQHTWGSSHALEWNWGYASGHDFWIDGGTSRVRSRLGGELTGTAVGAHVREQRFLMNGLGRVLRTRGPIAPDSWAAEAKLGPRRLHVQITPRRSDLIGVTYADPRGGSRVCYHTEVADLELRLTQGDEVLARIRRPASAAFEYGAESPVPGLPVLF